MNRPEPHPARRGLRWFLPREPDVLGLVRAQADEVRAGIDAFAEWSRTGGDTHAENVRDHNRRQERAAADLLTQLRVALSTPLGREGMYLLSERLGAVLEEGKLTVREAEAVHWTPDGFTATLGAAVRDATRQGTDAIAGLGHHTDRATADAQAAIGTVDRMWHTYREALVDARTEADIRRQIDRHDFYRRYITCAQAVERMAHRVWYTVLEEA